MIDRMPIPHSPADLSSSWLTMALRQGHAIGAATVRDFECSAPEAGKGFYGQIVGLKLTYDQAEADGPRSIIAKFSSSNPEMRLRPNTRRSYEREIRFYQDIAKQSVLPVPACYYADMETSTGWHVLLLEDLAPARSGSRTQSCSPAQARTAIRHRAGYHPWSRSPAKERFRRCPQTSSHIPTRDSRVPDAP